MTQSQTFWGERYESLEDTSVSPRQDAPLIVAVCLLHMYVGSGVNITRPILAQPDGRRQAQYENISVLHA
jgi:hypothetical protein